MTSFLSAKTKDGMFFAIFIIIWNPLFPTCTRFINNATGFLTQVCFIYRYSSLEVTKVNTYGLVFHWQGSDVNLKPLLFASHQGMCSVQLCIQNWRSTLVDVVPVDPTTTDQWTHSPYSGYYDGLHPFILIHRSRSLHF